MMKELTVFTPTYDRAYTLGRLYESLCRQSNKDFEWLVVDDGSKDGTEELIKSWQSEEKISIRYIYQENGGKMRAHNRGVKSTETELFVCVDSDDYLVDDGIEKILSFWKEKGGDATIAGLVGYRGKNTEETLSDGKFPYERNSTLKELYKNGFRGDSTLVYRTEVLRSFLFPEIEGEKFITEAYVYNQIDRQFQLLVLPRIIIVCNYLEDGYTRNQAKLRKDNPIGYALYCDQKAMYAESFKERWKNTINYVSYALAGKKRRLLEDSSDKVRTFCCYPLGYLLFLKRRYKNKKV
ncbi:glycosyltransferase family 2 protein [Gabonibacter chumensis]|uniref:glycosyltransferase family 2 protein n=1 Tax=Gabonibacter chumensis TaxID=2972474 RepID=UPI002573C117|nr:glycosyltransferase family 2 protein [Gabonibacter chumensis]MCR9011328.1 glycosyltransferase family 2 protein [Gabonibacter chumensis]